MDDSQMLGDFTRKLIRQAARRAVKKYELTASDRDDLEQELAIAAWQSLPRHDPKVGPREAFVQTVVKAALAGFMRQRGAAKRDQRRQRSLHAFCDDGEGGRVELGKTIDENQRVAHRGVRTRSVEEQTALALDVAAVLARLPEELRDLCEQLKHYSITETAQRCGLTPSAMQRALAQIRGYFTEADLQEYLRS